MRKLNLSPDNVVTTVDRHANTSAASIPLALSEATQDGRIKEGDIVLIEAIGGQARAIGAVGHRLNCPAHGGFGPGL